MASLQSSLNHGFPGCLGFVEVFGEYQENTTDMPQVTDKLYHTML